jgi:hypothetical protein
LVGKTRFSTPPRDYKIDGGGIAVSNPNSTSPVRVDWHSLIMALDAVYDSAFKLAPEFAADLDRA